MARWTPKIIESYLYGLHQNNVPCNILSMRGARHLALTLRDIFLGPPRFSSGECIFVWPNETAASGVEGTAEASEADEHDLDAENEDIEHTLPQQVLHGQGV